MPDFSSKDMAESLKAIGTVLVEYEVLTDPSPLHQAASQLLTNGERDPWSFVVSPSAPLTFAATPVEYLDAYVTPRLYSSIEISEGRVKKGLPPFSQLDCALEILNEEDNRLLLRTHIDLANQQGGRIQDGPLHHMQFGGHQPKGDRRADLEIKEPRWLHPPLDLILMCEIVVANFYCDAWSEMQMDARWRELILESQKICLMPFYRSITSFL